MTGGRITAVAVAAVLVFWMVGAYNRLVALRSAIGAAWGQVDEQLQRRRAILQLLLEALRPQLLEEAPALEALEGALLQVQGCGEVVQHAAAAAGPQRSVQVRIERAFWQEAALPLQWRQHLP